MEEFISSGLGIPVLLILAVLIIALSTLMLHLLFPPSKNVK